MIMTSVVSTTNVRLIIGDEEEDAILLQANPQQLTTISVGGEAFFLWQNGEGYCFGFLAGITSGMPAKRKHSRTSTGSVERHYVRLCSRPYGQYADGSWITCAFRTYDFHGIPAEMA